MYLISLQQGLSDFISCKTKSISNGVNQVFMAKIYHGPLCLPFFSGLLLQLVIMAN